MICIQVSLWLSLTARIKEEAIIIWLPIASNNSKLELKLIENPKLPNQLINSLIFQKLKILLKLKVSWTLQQASKKKESLELSPPPGFVAILAKMEKEKDIFVTNFQINVNARSKAAKRVNLPIKLIIKRCELLFLRRRSSK